MALNAILVTCCVRPGIWLANCHSILSHMCFGSHVNKCFLHWCKIDTRVKDKTGTVFKSNIF